MEGPGRDQERNHGGIRKGPRKARECPEGDQTEAMREQIGIKRGIKRDQRGTKKDQRGIKRVTREGPIHS